MSEHDAVVRYAYETGHLARVPRAGWQLAFVNAPESVAEHSHRTAILAYIIASLDGADAERAATLAVFHDVPETRTNDLHSVAKQNVTDGDPVRIARTQTAGVPADLSARIAAIVDEGEQKATREAICVKDADKLDCLLRAREYQAQGYTHVQPWVDSMAAAMKTSVGQALADRAVTASPGEWWHEIVSSYGRP